MKCRACKGQGVFVTRERDDECDCEETTEQRCRICNGTGEVTTKSKARKRSRYRAENSHSIGYGQVNKLVFFLETTDELAKKRFEAMRVADPTIQEAGLFAVKGNRLVDEYIGYI